MPAEEALAASVDSALAAPAFARASWGVVIQSLDDGRVLYRRNAERLFLPASNLKLVTAAAALDRLGPDFRWTTTVLARGARAGDTLVGDLVVVGSGDPTFSADAMGDSTDVLRSLRPFADSLKARGIIAIRGRVVGDASLFTDPPLGRGWAWDDLDADYSAPVGALQFNESVAWILATPASAAGLPVALALQPPAAGLRIFNAALTSPPDTGASRLHWSRAPFADSVSVWGALSAGHAPVRLPVSVPDPARYFSAALTEALTEGGVAVGGDTTIPTAVPAETLFAWRSPPLSAVLPLFLKPSQNQIGETLLRTLGAVAGGAGSVDSGRAVVRSVLAGYGVPADALVLEDGSGLSRYDYVAPEALAKVLAALYRRPDFQVLYDALPVAGVDGTLASRMKGTPAAGNVHAKTGSLTGVRSLSGYVTDPDGERLLFVTLVNDFTAPQRVVDAVQDWIALRLATFSRAGAGGR